MMQRELTHVKYTKYELTYVGVILGSLRKE